MDISTLIQFVNQLNTPDGKELITTTRDAIVALAKELKPLMEGFLDATAESRIRLCRAYINAGFTTDEAITMTLDDFSDIRKPLDKQSR